MKHLTQETGATVLFVSHSMDSVLEICNSAILLERGEITHQGTALEVSKIYNRKIRDEEELRARAKEYRVSRKTSALPRPMRRRRCWSSALCVIRIILPFRT